MTKINYEFIQKIFNRKIELKKDKDKELLSKYTEYIPMYDIYSDNIYPISSLNLHYRLTDCHYRFITSEVKKWIENKLEKTKDEGKKSLYQKNLSIINNYNLNILEKTSYETFYKYSSKLGLSISICKRNSFHPFSRHLNPYYTKDELVKLGVNNKVITEINKTTLIDKEVHYKICKMVSKNDVSANLISKHMKHIIDSECINWINFYSMMGSYILNDYLRTPYIKISKYMLDGLKKIVSTMKTVDGFDDNFYFYRFIWDDNFIKNLKIGDTFTDKGFLSTTRDPFYAPGVKLDFGLILIKVNIPKNKKGVGLFLENFSMFPKEEEFLLPPRSKLKLIAKNENFDYKHINENFEKKVKKKYEFDYIDSNFEKVLSLKASNDDIPDLDLEILDLDGNDRTTLFNQFLQNCDEMEQFKYKGKIYSCQLFDSTTSYKSLFYNKLKDGLLITHYQDGYPYFSIECGNDLVINFKRTNSFHDNNIKKYSLTEDEYYTIGLFSKIFKYKKALIFFPYKNFSEFKDNYSNKKIHNYLHAYMYCYTIYDYLKNKNKKLDKYEKFSYGFYKLDKLSKEYVSDKIKKNLPDKSFDKNSKILWSDLIIKIIENYFYLYPKLENWVNSNYENLFNQCYTEFDSFSFLKNNNFDISYFPAFDNDIKVNNRRYQLIFTKELRR